MRYREGSTQPVKLYYFEKAQGYVKIERRFEQRLADMTEEEAKAEGFTILSEFRKEYSKITNHPLDLEETVTAYEFHNTEKQQEQSTKP